MSADVWDVTMDQIEAADLPATVYRTAVRLLRRASNGRVELSEAELKQICQTDSEGTMRSHLVQLAAAGILRYIRRRLTIRVQFESWANVH